MCARVSVCCLKCRIVDLIVRACLIVCSFGRMFVYVLVRLFVCVDVVLCVWLFCLFWCVAESLLVYLLVCV